uniref:Alkylglycerol monooxygenase n=1 Tax=Plectus sambesii TaxID=2011161 RepID=A0A914W7T0_9BILA
AIGNLGILEYVLVTPSSHRVHHGRNPYCIDKNYGGTLIIWDILFGTFELERPSEPPIYGTVTTVNSFNVFYCQWNDFKWYFWGKQRTLQNFYDRIRVPFCPPAWQPNDSVRWIGIPKVFGWVRRVYTEDGIPLIQYPVIKYNPAIQLWLKCYIAIHFCFVFQMYWTFSEFYKTLSYAQFYAQLGFIFLSFLSFGFMLDKRGFSGALEIVRCLLAQFILLPVTFDNPTMSEFTTLSTMLYCLMSASISIWIVVFLFVDHQFFFRLHHRKTSS